MGSLRGPCPFASVNPMTLQAPPRHPITFQYLVDWGLLVLKYFWFLFWTSWVSQLRGLSLVVSGAF